MTSESNPPFIYLDIVRERESLKSATISQKTFGKVCKVVQFPHLGYCLITGPEIHMVGIGQNDLWLDEALQVTGIQGLDRPYSTHWHKDRCLYGGVGGLDGAGSGIAVCFVYLKFHYGIILSII